MTDEEANAIIQINQELASEGLRLKAERDELLVAARDGLADLKTAGSVIGIKYPSRAGLERAIARAEGRHE